jgi:hypothetical protein
MQFQVPQFIETEDKIVGPFTIKQFLYVGGAVGISFVLYFMLNQFLWFVFSLPILAVGIGLAFVKINGQPLIRTLTAAASFYWQPQTYVWQPENPTLQKNVTTLQSVVGSGFSLESILSGLALKGAREHVVAGSKASTDSTQRSFRELKERYEAFRGIGGERRVARRIDYR